MGRRANIGPPGCVWIDCSAHTAFSSTRRQLVPNSNCAWKRAAGEEQDEQTLLTIRESWSFGSAQFKLDLLQRLEGELGEHHSGSLHQQSSASRAERIIGEELTRLGWTEDDLATQRKSAPEKLAIAARLRKETTLTIKQIAARVHLGTSKGANANLHRFMRPNHLSPPEFHAAGPIVGI